MKLEDQVVSLELAKQLKELEVKQDSLWYYAEFKDDSYLDVTGASEPESVFQIIQRGYFEFVQFEDEEIYSAFTVAELGGMLPTTLECYQIIERGTECDGIFIQTGREKDGTWNCNDEDYYAKDKSEANVRAKMLIYLLSENCYYDDLEFLKWKNSVLNKRVIVEGII